MRQGGKFSRETLILEISTNCLRVLTKKIASSLGQPGTIDLRQHDSGGRHGCFTFESNLAA